MCVRRNVTAHPQSVKRNSAGHHTQAGVCHHMWSADVLVIFSARWFQHMMSLTQKHTDTTEDHVAFLGVSTHRQSDDVGIRRK